MMLSFELSLYVSEFHEMMDRYRIRHDPRLGHAGFSFMTASSAGRGAGVGLGTVARSRGGFLSTQPALSRELERRFGAEHGMTQLCHTGVLCENSGHFSSIGDGGNKQIVHNQAPLCGLSGWSLFLLSEGIIHWVNPELLDPFLSQKRMILIFCISISAKKMLIII